MLESLPALWIRIAVIYFVSAVLLGVAMGASGDHSLFPLHAHMNLLGWVSMALFGLLGKTFPEIASNRLAKLHFWIYNITLPLMIAALYCVLKGNAAIGPLLGALSAVIAVSIVLFALNVLINLRRNAADHVTLSANNINGRLTHK